MGHARRSLRAVAAVPLIAAALLLASPAPASANTPWVSGHGWSGESHLAGQGYITDANTVGVWEQALIMRIGIGWFTHDGVWGGNPETWWTNVWQSDHAAITPGLAVDGIVGPQTWSAARFWHLRYASTYQNWETYLYTDQAGGTVYFQRYIPWDGWQTHPIGCSSEFAYKTIGHPINDVPWWQNCE